MRKLASSIVGLAALGLFPSGAAALIVTQTTDGTGLRDALVANPSDFGDITATYTVGDTSQVGTYTGFSSLPVTIGNGVVLSTGRAIDTVGPYNNSAPFGDGAVSTAIGGPSTPEIDAYSLSHVTSWSNGNDAAVLMLEFDLDNPSAIAFSFIFGSVEYPVYTSQFTDAFLVFLDGNQITFDSLGNPVQVGNSFASQLRIDDTNTIFTGVGADFGNNAHGLLDTLITTSGTLDSGTHTILFEVSDTNDQQLDSAVFITNFRLASNQGGPDTEPETEDVPEPTTLTLFAFGLAGLGILRRKRTA